MFVMCHLAAIGITEETDCLSIVVSEETGRISVASFGELLQGLSIRELGEYIQRHFGVQRPSPMHIDKFASDIRLSSPGTIAPSEVPSADRVKQP